MCIVYMLSRISRNYDNRASKKSQSVVIVLFRLYDDGFPPPDRRNNLMCTEKDGHIYNRTKSLGVSNEENDEQS